jgi:hypothetical protein
MKTVLQHIFLSLVILSVFSCSDKSYEDDIRNIDKVFPASITEIYAGYPEDKLSCLDCEWAMEAIAYQNNMLWFKDYDHFIQVRNCLAENVESYIVSMLQNQSVSGNESWEEEEPLDKFEIWYPQYKSLRKLDRELETTLTDGDNTAIESLFPILDPVEMTLVSHEGKVGFGNEIFNIYDNPYEKSGCVNLRINRQLVYSGTGNYYFRMRNSIFPWPWGTTVYGTTVSLRKNANGTLTRVRKMIGVQGGGKIYDSNCSQSKIFSIFYSGMLYRQAVTRSYTEWGWPAGIKKNECSTFYYYQNLSPLGMYVY